eukprot:TRINITY_DN7140_c0_g1_i2.p1 TRINITY_DN7140_c0_g1~~TRINITY_DN7140_c0_g1_i2.p1  ORF type:complete len:104 (-),score=25.87 TRINITY_DN7140_c0_g1_i2:34-345(-)
MPSNEPTNKVAEVQRQADEVANIMNQNIQKQLGNMETADSLQGKTDDLRVQAQTFQKQAKVVKRRMCIRNWKLTLIIILVILLIAAAIAIPVAITASNNAKKQ